jgi:hypothetical protein
MKETQISLTMKFSLRLVGVSSIVMLLSFATAWSAEQNKWVLLIGIDHYQSPEIPTLRGAVNDVMLMRSILIGKFAVPPDHIKLLTNEQATHDAIVDAIRNHLGQAKPDDIAILHFSGHGSQIRDESGDEIDGFDETLVTYDDRMPGKFGIIDDEINGLIAELSKKTKTITLIFDSCHSGAAARAGNAVREIPADARKPPPKPDFAISSRGAEGEADMRLEGTDYVLISGSLAKELSNEGLFEGKRHGALTWFLAQALTASSERATYHDIMDEVRTEVNARYPTQRPQVEGPGQDRIVFGSDRIQASPYLLVKPVDDKTVEIDGGSVYGLQPETTLKVFPPQTFDFKNASSIATVKITTAQDFTANATIIEGGPVPSLSRALFEAITLGETSIPIYVEAGPKDLDQIKELLKKMPAITIVDDQRNARLVVMQQGGKLSIGSGDLEVLVPPVPVNEAGAAQHVADQVQSLVHWLMVFNLKNPTSGIQLKFSVRREQDPSGTPVPDEVSHGTNLTYVVHNRDEEALYVYVLDVSSDGSIGLLYPRTQEQQQLPAGGYLEKSIKMKVPDGRTGVVDVLKVLATTKAIDPSLFPQGPIRAAPVATLKGNPLERFLAQALRGTRVAEPVDVKTWTAKQVAIRIRKSGAKLSSFALHFDGPKEAQDIQGKLAATKDVCPSGDTERKDCERLMPFGKDQSTLEMTAYKAVRGDGGMVSVGQAFDDAYGLQDQTGAFRVEPMLEIQVPGVETEQGIDKRDIMGDDQHDPAAESDDRWSLKQIRAQEAWAKIRNRYHVAEGAEADGIFIAHPDTGYRKHPENWEEINGKRAIDMAKGHNYYEDNSNPEDPLLSDGLLDNPGHGTASGSVIVSPAGCQLQGAKGCVNGIARGAQLVPLRVHRSVSQFNMSFMAHAIQDVADGQIGGEPKLISIAMGGPPTITLWKAVKSAEQKGILIVAAAGNYVRTVVWPARFRSTIAVAATNVRCHPWKNSSRGHAVDISAPGESVWRATLNEKHDYINGLGKGTTFATGTTSGTAALWLAWHRGDLELQQLQQAGLVTQAFRDALRTSAWKPSADSSANPPETHCDESTWDSDFGPGILNASALLDVPLQVQSKRELLPAGLENLPLFASLYPEGTDPNRIKADYLSLFGQKKDVDAEELSNFGN